MAQHPNPGILTSVTSTPALMQSIACFATPPHTELLLAPATRIGAINMEVMASIASIVGRPAPAEHLNPGIPMVVMSVEFVPAKHHTVFQTNEGLS